MSASMQLHKCLIRPNVFLHRCKRPTAFRCSRTNATCTYVLLPEVPPDTAETNTLMNVNALPEWSKVTPANVYRACGKLAILYETKLGEHCEKLQDLGQPVTFDDVFKPIEEVSVPLMHAYKCVKHLSTVKKKNFSDAFEGIFKHVHRSRAERFQNSVLYHRIKELNADSNSLTEVQQTMVNMYLREARHAGVELTGKNLDVFNAHLGELAHREDQFRMSVYFSSRISQETVYDEAAVSEMPTAIRNRLSMNSENPEAGPWRFGVNSAAIYKPVLEYCPDRMLRKKIWSELVSIASVKHNPEGYSNKPPIESIRHSRRGLANLFGYSSYTEMVMQHRMAGSIENVMELIETLRSTFQPEAQGELDSLHKFASSRGFDDDLQMWDVNYWARKQAEVLYQVDLLQPSEYFPLPRVLHGMFQICEGLFGVQIKQRPSGSVDTWHPSVEVFDIFDEDGTEMATFYVDPYKRSKDKYAGAWINTGREKSDSFAGKPISFLNLNLIPSLGKQPSLMSVKDVALLFSMMGHTLQQLLTKVEYSELAGQNNIEWDAMNISSVFFTMWLMRPDTMRSLSCHWESNQQLSSQEVDNIIQAYNHMQSNNLMSSLFNSVYDLEMHFSEKHFDTAMRQLWPRYMLLPLDPGYFKPYSMVNVFADDKQASGVYAALWAEMVAADIMKSFDECNSMEELKATGRRFKDTVLALGGSVPAGEVFRRFKGRDPSINSLLQMKLSVQRAAD